MRRAREAFADLLHDNLVGRTPGYHESRRRFGSVFGAGYAQRYRLSGKHASQSSPVHGIPGKIDRAVDLLEFQVAGVRNQPGVFQPQRSVDDRLQVRRFYRDAHVQFHVEIACHKRLVGVADHPVVRQRTLFNVCFQVLFRTLDLALEQDHLGAPGQVLDDARCPGDLRVENAAAVDTRRHNFVVKENFGVNIVHGGPIPGVFDNAPGQVHHPAHTAVVVPERELVRVTAYDGDG